MKQFNSRLFIVLSILIAAIAFFSFLAAFSRDEGTLGTNMIRVFFADLFNVIRFPVLMLLPGITKEPLYFSLGLMVNCLLYSLVIERAIFYLFIRRSANAAEEN